MIMKCFLFADPVPTSLTGFVDDLAAKCVGRTAEELVQTKRRNDEIMAEELLAVKDALPVIDQEARALRPRF